MTTKLKGIEFKINWQYSDDKKKTTCYINADRGNGTITPVGSITIGLYYKDRFEYEKARKTSLKRLLEHTGFERAERAAIWKAYFDRKPAKTKK